MGHLRIYILERYRLALVLVLIALAMKALVPTGYMLGSNGKVLTIEICGDATGGAKAMQIVIPGGGKSSDNKGDHNKAAGTCPWLALSMGAIEGADFALLALALAFILLLGFAPVRAPVLAGQAHIRPPLRGPPVFA